uniref:peptidylglycine monooxygenase n=1 Tax=Arion vulgaris TaxID=1028688 RepID=A0A0B7AQ08_9EUPU
MSSLITAVFLLVIIPLIINDVLAAPQPGTTEEINLLMPKVRPQEPDIYLCKAMEVEDAHRYITGFVPNADSNIAHHMLLYGCSMPGAPPGEVWNCGEMSSTSSSYRVGAVCQEGNTILYAWAMEAPKLSLPKDVSFEIGQKTPIKFLVVQVHYKNVTKFLPPHNGDDSSGLTLITTKVPTSKQAGVYLMLTDGFIPAHSIEYFETACEFEEDIEIVPFAYRTHAHGLGRVISGYRIRDGKWTEIGRKDPRLPEMFYNTTNPDITVRRGDILAARCTMENTLEHDVAVGLTQNDEMCNFYIMYYVNRAPILNDHICGSNGPPAWYWSDFEDQKKINLQKAPETVSVLPGTQKPLIRNATYGDDDKTEETLVGIPGKFGDINEDEIVDKTIGDMSSNELLRMVHQLANAEGMMKPVTSSYKN